jgi:hypothetical protein
MLVYAIFRVVFGEQVMNKVMLAAGHEDVNGVEREAFAPATGESRHRGPSPWRRNPARVVGSVLLVAWAGFWSWFALAVGLSEGRPAAVPVSLLVSSVLMLTSIGLRWPRGGAVFLLAGALVAALIFRGATAWWLFCGPMVLAAGLIPWRDRR